MSDLTLVQGGDIAAFAEPKAKRRNMRFARALLQRANNREGFVAFLALAALASLALIPDTIILLARGVWRFHRGLGVRRLHCNALLAFYSLVIPVVATLVLTLIFAPNTVRVVTQTITQTAPAPITTEDEASPK